MSIIEESVVDAIEHAWKTNKIRCVDELKIYRYRIINARETIDGRSHRAGNINCMEKLLFGTR